VSSALLNHLGQPIGPPVPGWTSPARPSRNNMEGRYCRVVPLAAELHAVELYDSNQADREGRMWTYLPYGPFANLEEYRAWVTKMSQSDDPLFYAVLDGKTGRAAGVASYLRIDPPNGVIEVGHIAYSPSLQRTPAATEAMFLMMQHVFTLGYRRYEWKCDALNEPSRRAAERLGFTFEGTFRQAVIYKGRSRDTAWYSILDRDWPALHSAFLQWLDPVNFSFDGRQKTSLRNLIIRLKSL
jgi:RimJ/RimL family protein N-acetyltransferase